MRCRQVFLRYRLTYNRRRQILLGAVPQGAAAKAVASQQDMRLAGTRKGAVELHFPVDLGPQH